jgi:hypothetical protein
VWLLVSSVPVRLVASVLIREFMHSTIRSCHSDPERSEGEESPYLLFLSFDSRIAIMLRTPETQP